MSWWQWIAGWELTPISASQTWQMVIWMTVVALVVGGVLAHLPRVFPGAVSRAERAARGHWVGRLAGLCLLLAALAAGVAVTALVMPPRHPVVLVLHSRVRTAAWPTLTNTAAAGTYPVYDLAPVVNRVLQECIRRGGASWVTGGRAEREQLREALLASVFSVSERWLPPGDNPTPPLEPVPLPRWVVESVEVSIVQLAAARFRLRAVLVAAAPAHGETGSWPLAAVLLRSQGVPVECIRADTSATGGLTVERIASATLKPIGGAYELSFYAIVAGMIEATAQHVVPFLLRAEGEDVLAKMTISVLADGHRRRMIPFTTRVQLPVKTAEKPLYLADAAGAVVTRVQIVTAPPQVTLHLADPAKATLWKQAFALVGAPEYRTAFQPLRDDLQAQQTPLPALDGTPAGPTLVTVNRFLVVAASAQAARAAASRYETTRMPRPEPVVGTIPVTALRGVRSTLPAPATFSWRNLPLRPAEADVAREELPLAEGFEPLVWADRLNTPLSQGRRTAGRDIWPVVSIGRVDGGRFVVIDPDAPAEHLLPPIAGDQDRTYEPAIFLSLLYTVAWAAHFVADASTLPLAADAAMAGADQSDQEQLVGPAVRAEDISSAVAVEQFWWDRLGAAGLGMYFVLLALRLRASRRTVRNRGV